jgi:phosphoribosyl-AMP cyclohydrolase
VGAACHTGTRTCFDARQLDAVVGGAADENPTAKESK